MSDTVKPQFPEGFGECYIEIRVLKVRDYAHKTVAIVQATLHDASNGSIVVAMKRAIRVGAGQDGYVMRFEGQPSDLSSLPSGAFLPTEQTPLKGANQPETPPDGREKSG